MPTATSSSACAGLCYVTSVHTSAPSALVVIVTKFVTPPVPALSVENVGERHLVERAKPAGSALSTSAKTAGKDVVVVREICVVLAPGSVGHVAFTTVPVARQTTRGLVTSSVTMPECIFLTLCGVRPDNIGAAALPWGN